MSLVYLKVKIKSLAAEALIIRQEEEKAARWWLTPEDGWTRNQALFDSLHNHRTHDVRNEQRATLLAYGFLRGRSYRAIESEPFDLDKQIEQRCTLAMLIPRIVAMVQKYSTDPRDRSRPAAYERVNYWLKTNGTTSATINVLDNAKVAA